MADYFTGIGIVPYVVMLVLEFFAWVWSALTASYSLPGWILLIGIICALGFGLVCIVLAVLFFAESKPARKPEYEAYTEDVMFGAKWEWRWGAGGGILDLWCFCPVCQGILVWNASPYDDDIPFCL